MTWQQPKKNNFFRERSNFVTRRKLQIFIIAESSDAILKLYPALKPFQTSSLCGGSHKPCSRPSLQIKPSGAKHSLPNLILLAAKSLPSCLKCLDKHQEEKLKNPNVNHAGRRAVIKSSSEIAQHPLSSFSPLPRSALRVLVLIVAGHKTRFQAAPQLKFTKFKEGTSL